MRYIGTQARGIRLPVINAGDNLPEIVADYLVKAADSAGFSIAPRDIVGVTEAIVAKAQSNYATLDQLAWDIKEKYPTGQLGVVFPIFSRNRFLNILKGITRGAKDVFLLLSCPSDEVGNPIMDLDRADEIMDILNGHLKDGPVPSDVFRKITGGFTHSFTGVDYISLYESTGAKVYFSTDPRDILRLTPHVLAADIHTRFKTLDRLKKAGADTAYTLSDILNRSVDGSGFNPDFGVLGSNISSEDRLKLFPRECDKFVLEVQRQIEMRTGVKPEVMVYGDGAFKDPVYGIWELADPVVSPAFTSGLRGQPNEIKMKMVADTRLAGMSGSEQEEALKEIIREKSNTSGEQGFTFEQEGTTPRRYTDLLGSLCDLMSGSGDKGTPVVLIQGYFDNYAS